MPPPPATPAPRAASCFAKEAVRQGRPEPPPPPFQPHPSLRLRQTKGGVLRSHQPSRTQEFLIGGKVWKAPRGRGPYGIAATPQGDIYYASLAGNHIARIDRDTGAASVIEPPTPNQGARRVWSDSQGRIWVSEWTAGQLGLYDPRTQQWREWKLPGRNPQAYAVYVDARDIVWVSDWGANVILAFDPRTERFTSHLMSEK